MNDETTVLAHDVPVALVEYADRYSCEITVARLREVGIDASVSVASADGGVNLPSGHRVFVRRGDAERAAELVDWDAAINTAMNRPASRVGRRFWKLLGGE